MKLIQLRQLIREEIIRRLNESEASERAKELGLQNAYWGRWMDNDGNIVAKTVDGQLVKLDTPEEPEDAGIDPKLEKKLNKIFDSAGQVVPQPSDTGSPRIVPGWNKTKEDIPYDANGEETVKKLLAMVGDPRKLIRWLIKKFREETPNGKQRILQYLGILKDMGVGMEPEDAEQAPAGDRARKHDGDLFAFD